MPKVCLKVPYYKQQTDVTCVPACVKMALSYLGRNLSEQELVRLLNTRAIGTVVIGYDDDSIYVNDPYFDNAPIKVPLEEFMEAWTQTDYLLAVVSDDGTETLRGEVNVDFK